MEKHSPSLSYSLFSRQFFGWGSGERLFCFIVFESKEALGNEIRLNLRNLNPQESPRPEVGREGSVKILPIEVVNKDPVLNQAGEEPWERGLAWHSCPQGEMLIAGMVRQHCCT